jgi:Ca2+-binding RTX toxin-like protein
VQVCGGDDQVTISGGINLPALIDGGDGNDKLNGGNGPNIILGGDGNDQINGGSARDILIGGTGADRLVGNGDEDILIAGWTDHDAFTPTSYYESLWSVMNEWNSSSIQATRRSHLTGATGAGLNGSVLLNSATVHDDTDQDNLTGSSGNDWFFANLSEGSILDSITDKSSGEFWEELL